MCALSGVLTTYAATEANGHHTLRMRRQTVQRVPSMLDIFDIRAQFGNLHSRFAFILLFSRQVSSGDARVERAVIFEWSAGRAPHSWNESDGPTDVFMLPRASPNWLKLRFSLSTPRADRSIRASIEATIRHVGASGVLDGRHGRESTSRT